MLRSRRGLSHFGNRRVGGQVDCSLAPGSSEQTGCKKKSPSHYTGEGYSGGSSRCLSTYRQDLEVPSPEVTAGRCAFHRDAPCRAELPVCYGNPAPRRALCFYYGRERRRGETAYSNACQPSSVGWQRSSSSSSTSGAQSGKPALGAWIRLQLQWPQFEPMGNFLRQASWRSRRQEPSNYLQLWGLWTRTRLRRTCRSSTGRIR